MLTVVPNPMIELSVPVEAPTWHALRCADVVRDSLWLVVLRFCSSTPFYVMFRLTLMIVLLPSGM